MKKYRMLKNSFFRVVELFLSLPLDIASRKPNIVYNLSRVQGQIYVQKADVQASRPNHTMKRGKRRYIHRLQRMNPSLQHWMFREFLVSLGLLLVPRLCDRYVHLQLVVWFENQGLLAKISPYSLQEGQILGFLPDKSHKTF
jgi:hypothetical protein